MRVLLLADVPNGWIVDRIATRMIDGMPGIDFAHGYYCCLETEEILRRAAECDLVHFLNWNIDQHFPRVLKAGKPVLMSVRSHRFPPNVREIAKRVHVHVPSPTLQSHFGGSHYIPDGVDDQFFARRPVVGYAGQPSSYKGVALIGEACRKLGLEFRPAFTLPFDRMAEYYRSIDILVCASEAEGFGAPVLEALAMGKPVVSVRTGIGWDRQISGVTWVERSAEGITAGLRKHWPDLSGFRWPRVCEQFGKLYETICKTAA